MPTPLDKAQKTQPTAFSPKLTDAEHARNGQPYFTAEKDFDITAPDIEERARAYATTGKPSLDAWKPSRAPR